MMAAVRTRRAALAGLLVALLAPAASATGAGPTREEALHALADALDPDLRRLGALGLAERGTMADVPALAAALRDRDPIVRAFAERALWEVWSRSGDAEIDRLFQEGLLQMRAGDGEAAVRTFGEVIRRRPEFAEGWNKRATVYYLLGEYRKSLADCDEVLKRNAWHFGALTGYGMIYLKLDEPAKALEYFERALDVNPNLDEVRATVEAVREALRQRRKDTI
jgi:tetratricopeptide (TPR) repeat protein